MSFKGPKMPQSRAVRNLNTFIVMDVAAKAPQDLQVSTLLLPPQSLKVELKPEFVWASEIRLKKHFFP